MMLLGIAVLILGFLALLAPVASGIAVTTLVAVVLIAAGAVRTVWAFRSESFGRGALALVLGGLTLACGILMLVHPLLGLLSLTLLLAAYFLVDGVCEIAAAFQVRPRPGWGWLLASGIASLILGGLIWVEWPLSGAWAVGVLVGIRLMFAGSTMISFGSAIRAAADAP